MRPKEGDKLAGLRRGDAGFIDQTANSVVRHSRWPLLLVNHFRMSLPCDPTIGRTQWFLA